MVKPMNQTVDTILESVFSGLTPKQRRVIVARFGLKNGSPSTLQEIGNELGITRERVRQIENHTIKKISDRAADEARELIREAMAELKRSGGVRRSDELIAALLETNRAGAGKHFAEKAAFLFIAAGSPGFEKETDEMHAYWYADEAAKRRFTDMVKKITAFFKAAKKDDVLVGKKHLGAFPDFGTYAFLSIPKHFGTNVFGDFGLRAWTEIEPKTIRDKAYLVLKKHGKPLHFEDIAKYITKFGIDSRTAHVQTVHNELIKDKRFVLVGRGIYGLGEHGYEPGTVKDVIVKLLKKNGPMEANQVVSLVNEQRILKQNTILLSLQNKRHFRKLSDGRYHVNEA